MVRVVLVLGVFALALAQISEADEVKVGRYLFDARVHVALLARADGTGGELCWRDTVTGRSGEALFVRKGQTLLVEKAPGTFCEGHLVPDVALVVDDPPWGAGGHPSLGVALD
jgi:hypothetical protein